MRLMSAREAVAGEFRRRPELFNIAPPGGAVAAVAHTANHLDVFWIGNGGEGGTNWWDGNLNKGQWNAPFRIANAGAPKPGSHVNAVSRTASHLEVFWVRSNGSI